METRANYVLIGAATLIGIVAAFLFFLWYARISVDRQFDYYDILFPSVGGLSQSADVQFNGVGVGRVIGITLDPPTGQVRVEIEVADGTPVRQGTVAALESQGVTGVSFVALTGGRADAPPLEPPAGGGRPVIPSRLSAIGSLIETAPELLARATELLEGLSEFVTPENQARVAGILANVETASGGLEKALSDFSAISGTVREGVDQISAFTGRLDGIATQATQTLRTADGALAAAEGAFTESQDTLRSATGALDATRTTVGAAGTLLAERGPGLADSYEGVARSVDATVALLGDRLDALADRLDGVADLAAARLRDAEAPIAAATPALAAIEGASREVERLVSQEGAALVGEARMAIATLDDLLSADAPRILGDARAAAAAVRRIAETAEPNLVAASGRIAALSADASATLAAAGETFRTANATLTRLGPAVESAERALGAAESAFAAADRVMTVDVEPIAADVRAAVQRLDAAIAQVSADLPAITAETRAAAESAGRAAGRLETMIGRSAPPVEAFAQTGLPDYARLAQDARALVVTLERLALQLQQDPARFLLGGQTPEYRR